jgi:hypothetical protein
LCEIHDVSPKNALRNSCRLETTPPSVAEYA